MKYPDIIHSLPEIDLPLADVSGYLLQGENNQLVFFDFKEETLIPEHSHGAQWGIVVDGSIEMTIGEETKTYRKGDSYFIPSKTPHSGIAKKGFKAIDFFEDKGRY